MIMGAFENDLKKLEEISQKLQSKEIGIEKSIELYSQGMKLADELQDKLDKYKSKIEVLENEVDK